jgi:GTP-binding protein
MYMDRMLEKAGVYETLRKLGAKDGDFVVIGDIEFEYVE